jgi:hypothetical protein
MSLVLDLDSTENYKGLVQEQPRLRKMWTEDSYRGKYRTLDFKKRKLRIRSDFPNWTRLLQRVSFDKDNEDLLSSLNFDYMWSSEFEFGEVPRAIYNLAYWTKRGILKAFCWNIQEQYVEWLCYTWVQGKVLMQVSDLLGGIITPIEPLKRPSSFEENPFWDWVSLDALYFFSINWNAFLFYEWLKQIVDVLDNGGKLTTKGWGSFGIEKNSWK